MYFQLYPKKPAIPYILIAVCIAIVFSSCDKLAEPFSPGLPEDNAVLDGPLEGLSPEQKIRHIAGDVAFNDEIFTESTGLGPCFVASSCGSCHAGDGKGHPFTTLIRFGQTDSTGNQYHYAGGPQVQNRALPNYKAEILPAGVPFSRFTPPANTGLGFLEALTDEQILANSDPNDADGNGISGRPNYIDPPSYFYPDPSHKPRIGKYIGRFGKKAAALNLLHQTARAYNQDMGVLSAYEAVDAYSGFEEDPEVSNKTVQDVVFYLQTLKAPIQRNTDNADINLGKQLFVETGCEACHKSTFNTGKSSIEALSNKRFYPYSDLLLHDMGPGLDDGYTEGMATTAEWRTPPLWGIGLSKNSQGGAYYLMHDGRAKSILEAIQLHGGEAQNVRNKFMALPAGQQNQLIRFLESL